MESKTMTKARTYTAETKTRLVNEFIAAKGRETLAAFCRRKDVPDSTLSKWLRKAEASDRPIDIRPMVTSESIEGGKAEYIPMVIDGRKIWTNEAGMRLILREIGIC